MRFDDYAAVWLRRMKRRVRPTSWTKYELYVRRHLGPMFGPDPLRSLRRRDVRALAELLEEDGFEPPTITAILGTLSAIYRAAIEEEILEANPVAGLVTAYARRRRKRTPLTDTDASAFLAAVPVGGGTQADALLHLLRTGMRLGEALALQPHAVNLDRATVHVAQTWHGQRRGCGPTKNGIERDVDLTPATVALLAPRVTDPRRRWLFENPATGYPWSPKRVQEAFERVLRVAGVPRSRGYTPHSLRHTYATWLVRAGVDLRYVQEQLGHTRLAMTSDYYARYARRPRPNGLEKILDKHPGLAQALGAGGGADEAENDLTRRETSP